MKEKNKKKNKARVICKVALVTLMVAGAGFLAYKKIPKVKEFVNELLPFGKTTLREIKTKPFRKYETFKKK